MLEQQTETSGLASRWIKRTPIARAVAEYVASFLGHSSVHQGIVWPLQKKAAEVSQTTTELLNAENSTSSQSQEWVSDNLQNSQMSAANDDASLDQAA